MDQNGTFKWDKLTIPAIWVTGQTTRAGDVPALDLAMLVLSAVERRLQDKDSEAIR